ncbi:DUF4123 domain-containing protein [Iodobacter sp. LRB]|uniref:DUF4123 domain-containing protein n=1 Tax=unclassified Iodobacter TaxID=235634 RepID=UPI000C11F8F3|nr:DUF4123 domain-containing protein [Iodobacter sp. BJB302]PHV01728.1 hypothetical protein CSQ88_10805 [Iodobacter sp. BJB302]
MKNIDSYPAEIKTNILAWLSSFEPETFNIYALIDHSFDPRLIKNLKNKIRWVSLYQDEGADVDISPILCHLEDKAHIENHLDLLLHATNGQPMLSFWLSALEPEVVYSHFASYTDVTILPEKLSYMLRYADTRILPNLLDAMQDEQRALFLGAFYSGIYFNRAAKMVQLKGGGQLNPNDSPLCITEQQFTQMLDVSQLDQIIQQLRKLGLTAELIMSESQIYTLVKQFCSEAHAAGITDFAELRAYCIEHFIEITTA